MGTTLHGLNNESFIIAGCQRVSMASNAEIIDAFVVQFTKFVYDNFLSTEAQVQYTVSTGYIVSKLHYELLSTGEQQGSTARFHYDNEVFNPYFSILVIKARLDTNHDNFAFIGFKETQAAPLFDMTESHAGFMFYKDPTLLTATYRVYISCGDGEDPVSHQQRITIEGLDPTDWYEYKIVGSDDGVEFWVRPLPVIYPYFNDIEYINTSRNWQLVGKLSTVLPQDQVHYVAFSITNTTNVDCGLEISHIIYGERYAD